MGAYRQTGWYEGHHGWKERNRVYLDACDALFREVATKAIEQAGLKPSDIDGVVMVSTTGIATPSIEARNGPAIGLRDDARRVPIFGMGCAGGVNGLATAARLAESQRVVLLLPRLREGVDVPASAPSWC